MRMGRVTFRLSYVVDLDNPEMVSHAKEALYDDVDQIVRENDTWNVIGEEEDYSLDPSDIPEFIREDLLEGS